ncbi:MAG TPA: DUF1735 domain-containing protein [Chitinophagaceae bacterium]|nr:DUF1735 domain-containing protein [Chitinophagaceae bacterium]
MKLHKLNHIFLLGVVVMLFASCIKDAAPALGDRGKTIVKLLEAPENKIFFEPFTNIRDVSLFSLRKDAPSAAELNTPTPVKVRLNPTLISDFNAANGETFEPLPDSLYTLDPTIVKSGQVYTMTLNSGDFAKDFGIKLNGAKWNLSHKYALGFTIEDASGKTISSTKNEVLALISIKNKWDGVYEVTGTFSDVTNAAFTGIYPHEWELQTTSATQCVVVDNVYLGFPGYVFETGGGLSYYGSFGLLVNFDPATDQITSVVNYYGQPASNTRSAALDPSGVNAYDESTKTVNIKYYMKQPSVIPAAPNIRCYFDETWKFVRSR